MNSESIFLKPTFYALELTGIIILIILILIALNYKKLLEANIMSIMSFIALLGILIGNHGNLHYLLEKDYNYNPLKTIYSYFNT